MPSPPATRLLHGPYVAPDCSIRSELYCLHSQRDVRVAGFTEALIPWPYSVVNNGHRLVLCGDLLRAVWAKRSDALAHHWGVEPSTVNAWRLSVPSPLEGREISVRSKSAARCRLVGQYSSLEAKPGDTLRCARKGDVVVAGMTDAPVPWPFFRTATGRTSLVLTGDLVRAIRNGETTSAIGYHWQIADSMVTAFRKALGIANATKGPRRAHLEWGDRPANESLD
jgi:hypothetical protein